MRVHAETETTVSVRVAWSVDKAPVVTTGLDDWERHGRFFLTTLRVSGTLPYYQQDMVCQASGWKEKGGQPSTDLVFVHDFPFNRLADRVQQAILDAMEGQARRLGMTA